MKQRSVGTLATALVCAVAAGVGFSVTAGAVGIVPPSSPTANVALPQSLISAKQAGCKAVPVDNSASCTQALLAEINYGLYTEGVAPISLPSNWAALTVPEQIFVIVDLERVARGLRPLVGLNGLWDLDAQIGAGAAGDPPMPPGILWTATEWAGGPGDVHSALEATCSGIRKAEKRKWLASWRNSSAANRRAIAKLQWTGLAESF